MAESVGYALEFNFGVKTMRKFVKPVLSNIFGDVDNGTGGGGGSSRKFELAEMIEDLLMLRIKALRAMLRDQYAGHECATCTTKGHYAELIATLEQDKQRAARAAGAGGAREPSKDEL